MNIPARIGIVGLIVAGWVVAEGRVLKTTRRQGDSNVERAEPQVSLRRDTIVAPHTDQLVRLSGYDKPLNASREVIFATNNCSDTIVGMTMTVSYYDLSDRLLHRRAYSSSVALPPGETRRLEMPTWDTNRSYYYKKSRRPRTSATPYDVAVRVDTIFRAIRNDD